MKIVSSALKQAIGEEPLPEIGEGEKVPYALVRAHKGALRRRLDSIERQIHYYAKHSDDTAGDLLEEKQRLIQLVSALDKVRSIHDRTQYKEYLRLVKAS